MCPLRNDWLFSPLDSAILSADTFSPDPFIRNPCHISQVSVWGSLPVLGPPKPLGLLLGTFLASYIVHLFTLGVIMTLGLKGPTFSDRRKPKGYILHDWAHLNATTKFCTDFSFSNNIALFHELWRKWSFWGCNWRREEKNFFLYPFRFSTQRPIN